MEDIPSSQSSKTSDVSSPFNPSQVDALTLETTTFLDAFQKVLTPPLKPYP